MSIRNCSMTCTAPQHSWPIGCGSSAAIRLQPGSARPACSTSSRRAKHRDGLVASARTAGAQVITANTEYNVVSACVFEVVGTFLFLVCILGVTHPLAPTGFAGLAIGLTLVVIPPRRHQHHRHLGQSCSFDRPSVNRRGDEARSRHAIVALHHHTADRRGSGGLPVQERRAA
jgi:hypothetical protein